MNKDWHYAAPLSLCSAMPACYAERYDKQKDKNMAFQSDRQRAGGYGFIGFAVSGVPF